jgi:long-chain acyl-CoA synthetase
MALRGAMLLDSHVGGLNELATGRWWDQAAIRRELGHRLAFFRALGLAPADRVLLHHTNTAEFFVDLLAIWGLGGCVIPMDPRLTAFEVGNVARAATARFSIWRDSRDATAAAELSSAGVQVLETPTPVPSGAGGCRPAFSGGLLQPDQPALILFTSGTTGEPKGVVHTHGSLRARWMSLKECLGTETFRRTLCILPTHFGHGLICNSLFPWLSGQDLFIAPPFRPDVLTQLGALLDEHGITFMSSVPLVWQLVLRTARPPARGSLARVFCGSAPLSASLWRGIQGWTGINEVVNAYGITETGSWVAGTSMGTVHPEDGLIGVPWGTTIKILRTRDEAPASAPECGRGEAGHVWLNTPALMRGYLGRDDLTREVVSQGWFRTGDIGRIDDRGFLYLHGREREEINEGGMKVYPGDVDVVAERFEQTLDVCTFAHRDPRAGESVAIALVLKSTSDETIRLLHAQLRRHLAKFQMPQRWYLVTEIPRTSRGKINRAKLAETCASLEPLDLHRIVRGKLSGA